MKKILLMLSVGLFFCNSSLASQEMLRNGALNANMNHWWKTGVDINFSKQEACIKIDKAGSNAWDVIFGQSEIAVEKGHEYSLEFEARSLEETQFKTLVQHNGPPYSLYFIMDVTVNREKQSYYYEFTHEDESDANSEFQFQMGGQKATIVCFSNVSLKNNSITPEPTISDSVNDSINSFWDE